MIFLFYFLFLQDQNVCEKIIIKWKKSDISTKSKDGWFYNEMVGKKKNFADKKKIELVVLSSKGEIVKVEYKIM
jgi:hypothetical protein